MDVKDSLEVSSWAAPTAPPAVTTKTVSRVFPPRVMGVIGTVLFHVLMVQTIALGSRAPKLRPPEEQGPGATLIKASAEPEEALVLVQVVNTVSDRQELLEDVASAGSAAKNMVITIINPDPLPQIQIPKDEVGESTDAHATVDSGDPASRARLFGIYTGQIEARISRAWRRPRSLIPIKASVNSAQLAARSGTDQEKHDFQCQIRILQDAHGYVQEVQRHLGFTHSVVESVQLCQQQSVDNDRPDWIC